MTQPTLTHEQLLTYLDSDENEYGLDSIATHGFLTATIVGKPLDNWIATLFDKQDKLVDNGIIQALYSWQAELLMQVKNEQPIELPFVESDASEENFSAESDWAVWSVGFIDAMYANDTNDWFADADTQDDVAMLTLPMLVFSGVDEDDDTLRDLRSDDGILAQMANNIEANLTELFLLFHTDV